MTFPTLRSGVARDQRAFHTLAHTSSRGFTLIELLVVIAIIGILSAIVLASLSQARGKGGDGAIKADLGNLTNQAELYYQSNNGYGSTPVTVGTLGCTTGATGTMFADPTIAKVITGAVANIVTPVEGTTHRCTANGSTYAVMAKLSGTNGWWCVDSGGIRKNYPTTQTLISLTSYSCP
jgi:prepilin-type N-terminal cleavage/methylation domain-containing protein